VAKKKTQNETPPPFEKSMARLEDIVRELEDGQLGLNDSLQRFEEGVRCLKQCNTSLADAERKIEILCDVREDGTVEVKPFAQDSLSLEEKAESRSRRRSHPPSAPEPDEDSLLF